MEVTWLDAGSATDELRREWNALLERDPDASIFQTPEWVETWWQHLGRGRARTLTIRRQGRLVALLPLCLSRESVRGLPVRVLACIGEPEADRLGVLSDPGDAEALDVAVEVLAAAADFADMVRLYEVATDSRAAAALERLRQRRPGRVAHRLCSRAPVFGLGGPWEAIEAGYSRALRTRLRRARTRQAKAGGLEFRRWQPEPAQVPELLARLSKVEAKSWKGRLGVGIFSTPERTRFYADLSLKFARRGWLDVAVLERDGDVVAYRYGFRFRGLFLDYNLAHRAADENLSPGRVLLDEVVRDSHRLGLAGVDASRGSLDREHLLADWASTSRWHARWLLFGPTLRGRLLAFGETRARPALRRLARAGCSSGTVAVPTR